LMTTNKWCRWLFSRAKREWHGSRSRRFRIEFGIPNEIIRKYSETAWKFGLCHFLGRKKCGNWNFVIFYDGNGSMHGPCAWIATNLCTLSNGTGKRWTNVRYERFDMYTLIERCIVK
jgi:hypothetical protein